MVYFVVKFEPKNLNQLNTELLTDMTVSKNSIHVRDGGSVGLDKNHLYVRVMGGDEKVEAARKLFEAKKFGTIVPASEADKVSKAIDKEEEDAAEGMGAIFG